MLAEERYAAILAELAQRRAATVAQLCAVVGGSESTIRRDLTALARQSKLNKVHGGATALEGKFHAEERDVTAKAQMNVEEKRKIATFAATLVTDDDFVFIDAGTTTMCLVEKLPSSKATFVTTGVVHALRLLEKGLKVYVVGGQLKHGTEAIVGAAALSALSQYNFTKAFIGANGVAIKQGYTTPAPDEAAIKTKATEQAHQTYVLADSSKFGKVSAVTICPLNKASIITDALTDSSYSRLTTLKEVSKK